MKSALWFGAKFVVLTVALTWLFLEEGGKEFYCKNAYRPVARFLYDLFGAETLRAPCRERFINLVPFVALMLLTPRIGWRRRLAGLGIGLPVLFASHIALNWLLIELRGSGASLRGFLSVFSDTLPFIIWAALNRELVTHVARRVAGANAAGGSSPPQETPRQESTE